MNDAALGTIIDPATERARAARRARLERQWETFSRVNAPLTVRFRTAREQMAVVLETANGDILLGALEGEALETLLSQLVSECSAPEVAEVESPEA